jgi:hypothetical protein
MLIKSYVAVIFVFVFVLCYASIDAKHQENQTVSDRFGPYVDIDFHSEIPIGSKQPVVFNCGNETFELPPSRHSHVITIHNYEYLSCNASWAPLTSTLLAFDPHKDAVFRQTVYWVIGSVELVQWIDNFPHRKAAWVGK